MPVTIELPDGHTAVLKTSEELSNKSVKELRRAARKVGLVSQKLKDLGLDQIRDVPEDADDDTKTAANTKTVEIFASLTDDEDNNLDLFQRMCTVIRLVSWTLDQPIPSNTDEVDELERPLYQALTTEAVKLNLNETFDKDDGLLDPKADTADSDSSKPLLEAVSY